MSGDTPWAMLLVTTPTDISPLGTDVVSRPALVLLIKIARHTSVTTFRGLRKDKLITERSWRVQDLLGPHRERCGVRGGRERELRVSRPGVLSLWG